VAKGFPEPETGPFDPAIRVDFIAIRARSRRSALDSSGPDCLGPRTSRQWAMADASTSDREAAERSAALAAFLRVFNPKTVAIVFYFTVLFLLGSTVIAIYFEPLDETIFRFARTTRQNLITGLMLLFGMGVLEALLAKRRVARRTALRLGVLTAIVVTALSIPIRIVVIESPLSRIQEEPGYFLSLLLLWSLVGSLGYWLFRSLHEDHLAREELADAECRSETLHAQMIEARLSALQAQIEPHFLFNTLANVKRLYETVPDRGREMLSSLISYLRAALPSMRQSGSTLGRELDLARSFLTILKMRMGDRLDFTIEADPALQDAEVPPMVLPTLVENAIKHGLSPLPEGGRIDIAARREGESLLIDVRDNGAGFSSTGGSGVGLANTRSRLAALFGNDAALALSSAVPRGVVASLRMPYIVKEAT
jgi:sensor histidine kinase YesM